MTVLLRWPGFGTGTAELAAAGREVLYQFGVGLAFLSTVRADGGPRLHPPQRLESPARHMACGNGRHAASRSG